MMSMTTTTATATECPKCGKKGKTVKPVTVRALLKDEYATEIAVAEQSTCESGCQPSRGNTGWRFCDAQGCDVVYFAEESEAKFTKSQLKVAVGVKETTGERPMCYCFGHSVASMKDDLRRNGRSDALEDIRKKMKDPGCSCEVKNPSGSCCLGAVAKGMETAKFELNPTNPTTPSGNKAETISKVGTVLSAIMASSCCWLPLLLLAFGVSGAGIAGVLESYRPLFIVLTFAFLAAAFYFTYRPRKSSVAPEHGCCGPQASEAADKCCGASGKRRLNMMTLNKIMLWVVSVLAVGFLFFPGYVGLLLGTGDRATVTAEMNRAVVKIEGMTCEGCAAVAKNAIRSVPGVLAVDVSYEKGEAVIGTEPCCPVPIDEILAALQKVGYSGTIVEPEK
jgi:copper chaperone CopZ